MLQFFRTNQRLMGLWLLPVLVVALLAFTCTDCIDDVSGMSHDQLSSMSMPSMSDHHCCNEYMDDADKHEPSMSCEMACAEVANVSTDSEPSFVTVDEYMLSPDILLEQYYVFVQHEVTTNPDPNYLFASYNPDLPEQNRILLI